MSAADDFQGGFNAVVNAKKAKAESEVSAKKAIYDSAATVLEPASPFDQTAVQGPMGRKFMGMKKMVNVGDA